jgi:hypothetical protein
MMSSFTILKNISPKKTLLNFNFFHRKWKWFHTESFDYIIYTYVRYYSTYPYILVHICRPTRRTE